MESNADVAIVGLWQKQAKEDNAEQVMPLDEIRTRAERLDTNTRRWRVTTAALVILLVTLEAWQVWRENGILERAGDLLIIAAFVYIAYRYRKSRLVAPPVALGRTNCVDFYHAELVRQRDLSKDSWGFLLPFVPGVALAMLGGGFVDRPTSQMIALVAGGVALFLGIAWWNARAARRLQSEIDALDVS